MRGEQGLEQCDGVLGTVEKQQRDGLIELGRTITENVADGRQRKLLACVEARGGGFDDHLVLRNIDRGKRDGATVLENQLGGIGHERRGRQGEGKRQKAGE